jgi:hypothetical protein
MLEDFRAFILRGNVVDLAVAVVIGAAFGAVVASRPAQGRERPDSMSRRSRRAAASGQGANSTA